MRTVTMYQAVDGKVFDNAEECAAHDKDCIGAEFDGLLLEAVSGNVTRSEQYRMCLHLLENRKAVLPILKTLVAYIEGEDEE